jgi:hypothetical protein
MYSQNYNQELQQSFLYTYQFQFQKADSSIGALKRNYSKAAVYIASANCLWYKIVCNAQNKALQKQYDIELQKAENLCKQNTSKEKSSAENLYEIINVYGQRTRIEGYRKNYFKSLLQVRKCVNEIEKSFHKEKEFEYFLLTTGLFHYYASIAETRYPFIKAYTYFLPSHNMQKGIDMLEIAAKSNDIVLKTEANYFLQKIYFDEKKYSQAIPYLLFLTQQYNQNLLYKYYLFLNYLKLNEKEMANKILSEINIVCKKNNIVSGEIKDYFLQLCKEKLSEYYLQKLK